MAKTRTSWQQGVSGNPSGRPRVVAEIRDAAREYGPDCIAQLVKMAGINGTRGASNEAVRLGALKELLDRSYGKATTVIAGNESETPVQIDFRWAPASEAETASTHTGSTATAAALTAGEDESDTQLVVEWNGVEMC
jgi:hypothetical protein